MNTVIYAALFFGCGVGIATAQSTSEKPTRTSTNSVDQLRADQPTNTSSSQSTKGAKEHGPNDINAVRARKETDTATMPSESRTKKLDSTEEAERPVHPK